MHADGATSEPPPDQTDGEPDHPHPHHRHPHLPHPHLIDAGEDRWRWRARIRRDPRKLFFYRIGVALAGLLLMITAVVLGPLPGPGGVPLFLLGLAVWSSEFERAQVVMRWFKAQFARYLGWTRGRRAVFWIVIVLAAWSGTYLTMLLYGLPPWLPEAPQRWLRLLPGLG